MPRTGDRGPVLDALHEVVDAAGGLEYSREALRRAMAVAQEEFDTVCVTSDATNWGGANTPAVYYEFCNAVNWTRSVEDRYEDRLRPALRHDPGLWRMLQKIRSTTARSQFDDARLLAKCALHKFTPPYSNAGAKVKDSILIYPVPDQITDAEDFRANLQFASGRHAAAVIEEYWDAVTRFIGGLLDTLYARRMRIHLQLSDEGRSIQSKF
jgi:hypothetical protein